MPHWSPNPSNLSRWQQRACGSSDLSCFLASTEHVCVKPRAIPPQHDGNQSPPGILGWVVPKMNKERVTPPTKFAQLTNIVALKLYIPISVQLNDLFPLLIAAWLTADPSVRFSSRMLGCFPARLQLILKPL